MGERQLTLFKQVLLGKWLWRYAIQRNWSTNTSSLQYEAFGAKWWRISMIVLGVVSVRQKGEGGTGFVYRSIFVQDGITFQSVSFSVAQGTRA